MKESSKEQNGLKYWRRGFHSFFASDQNQEKGWEWALTLRLFVQIASNVSPKKFYVMALPVTN